MATVKRMVKTHLKTVLTPARCRYGAWSDPYRLTAKTHGFDDDCAKDGQILRT